MTGWMMEAVIASAVLMAIVLVIRAPVRRYFGPGIAYALWALPAVRLVLPPIAMPSWLGWHSAPAPQIARQASKTLTVYVIEPIAGSTAAPSSLLPSLGAAAAVLWGVGAVAFVIWHATNHMRFCHDMLERSTSSSLAGDIEVIETDAASGPLAFGIFRRYVAFPPDFAERYDADERELALAHELGHHARGDLVANWVALFVLAIHWFNPLAWRAFRAFRADQEMANDARVLAGRSAIDRHTYACAIVKAAHGGAVSAACHLHTVQDLKGRLRMLTTGRRSRLRLTVGAATVGLLTMGGLAATASGTAAAATVRARVEKVTGIDFTRIDAKLQSTPPAPPAAPEGAAAREMPAPPPAPAVSTRTDRTTSETTTTISDDGDRKVKRIRIVKMDKDGKVLTDDYRTMPDMANIPDVRSSDCGGGEQPTVINKMQDGHRLVIICNDRINRVTVRAEKIAIDGKEIARTAKLSALSTLRASRASIASNMAMGEEARAAALEGIDDAIREVQEDANNDD